MFSVKHIQLSGHEDIYLTKRVSYDPPMEAMAVGPGIASKTPPTIWIDSPDGPSMPLTGGTVFVMNESGKTVSRYDIGASMIPLTESSPISTVRLS